MGTDIHGHVEVRPYSSSPEHWQDVMKIDGLLHRNYDMFAFWFGVRNYDEVVQPQFPDRGFPENPSETTKQRFEEYGCEHSPSYMTWAELENVITSEDFTKKYMSPYTSEHDIVDGKVQPSWCSFLSSSTITETENRKIQKGLGVIKGNKLYRREMTSASEQMSDDWKTLIRHMKIFAKHYGKENVRLVVWFDS